MTEGTLSHEGHEASVGLCPDGIHMHASECICLGWIFPVFLWLFPVVEASGRSSDDNGSSVAEPSLFDLKQRYARLRRHIREREDSTEVRLLYHHRPENRHQEVTKEDRGRQNSSSLNQQLGLITLWSG